MEEKMNNLASYNANMKKSLMDKIFFVSHTDATVFVDFGSADGEMIKFMNMLFPENIYIGYDISEEMLRLAHINIVGDINKSLPDNIMLCSKWTEVIELLETKYESETKAIVLNSVIHEVYSYATLLDIDTFWNNIFSNNFNYVIIRDMLPSISINKPSDINDVVNVRKKADKAHLSDYENKWGSINQNKNLIHFLLKYRWIENWNREVKENYFPLSVEEFMEQIPDNYVIDFYNEFVLPFTKRQIFKDFNIELKDNTHLKCIIRKK